MSEVRAGALATEAEYLIAEFATDERNEYVDGLIRSMTGASIGITSLLAIFSRFCERWPVVRSVE